MPPAITMPALATTAPRVLRCGARAAASSPPPTPHAAAAAIRSPPGFSPKLHQPAASIRARRAVTAASMRPSVRAGGAETPPFVELANELADAAGEICRKYFRTPVEVDCKKDSSPVTIADRACETEMRDMITKAFPNHAVFGEEFGLTPGDGTGEYMWVLDPIDGTKSFITGKPLFGILIALLHNGVPVLGVIDQPITRERWLGAEGQRTTLNGKEIGTRACSELSSAYLYATTPHMFSGANEAAFNRLRDEVFMPLYGCDCYAYGLLAAGHCDLVAEADLKPYDFMALVPVITGAGGVVTDWQGGAITWKPDLATFDASKVPAGCVLAAGDQGAHALALKALDYKGE